ncbi:uncharacterized protein SETTUDRAFT_23023 [Exserohilum turcica Et28A]|uniref:Uncharacterized protein n=1 Tax=Exserohilum turcicum (strain 28A) TaxID=671987 RepID=R0JPD3_EXST2|nr:uncharacterized protein SETTUDRAFT_23023 [Exserohilum turcica Et28A]EOA83048.1 hypothetical protein SETTUDRAFT_23023 [Exserohilum turcica Et28A]
MQFSVFSTGFLVAIIANTAFAAPPNLKTRAKGSGSCYAGVDCCYSSSTACYRQNIWPAGYINCNVNGASTWCSDVGITKAQCDADCCSVSTGYGRSCPA